MTQAEITIKCNKFLNCGGPFLQHIHSLVSKASKAVPAKLPVFNELHGKAIFQDPLGFIPEDAPMTLCADETSMFWTPEEREEIEASDFPRKEEFLGTLPSGFHFRPFGNRTLAMLWEYVHIDYEPSEPPHPEPEFDPYYPEITLRGMCSLVPSFRRYISHGVKKVMVDGGYYCKTQRNMPLIDSVGSLKGAFVFGGISGFGIMSSCAGGELIAQKILGHPLPSYAGLFSIEAHQEVDKQVRQGERSFKDDHRKIQL